ADKMHMTGEYYNLNTFKNKLVDNVDIYPISTITKEGIRYLLFAIANLLDEIPKDVVDIEETEHKVVYRYEKEEAPFTISRDTDGAFKLSGHEIERLFQMTDFAREEAAQRFSRQLRTMGVDKALRDKGVKDGDTI